MSLAASPPRAASSGTAPPLRLQGLAGASATDPVRDAAALPPPGSDASTSTAAVDQVLSQLVLGNVAFNSPSTINIAETVSIRVALSPDQSERAVLARVQEPGEKISQSLQVSNLMEARLSGEGFKIAAVTAERQAVSSGVTEWIWDVTPTREGRHQLTLTIDALITVNGELVPKTLQTFRKPIEVDVTTRQWIGGVVSEHGKWAWTTLLLPLWGWFAKRRKDRPGQQVGSSS